MPPYVSAVRGWLTLNRVSSSDAVNRSSFPKTAFGHDPSAAVAWNTSTDLVAPPTVSCLWMRRNGQYPCDYIVSDPGDPPIVQCRHSCSWPFLPGLTDGPSQSASAGVGFPGSTDGPSQGKDSCSCFRGLTDGSVPVSSPGNTPTGTSSICCDAPVPTSPGKHPKRQPAMVCKLEPWQ